MRSRSAVADDSGSEAECRSQIISNVGGINKQQPIAVGKIIYQKEVKAKRYNVEIEGSVLITYLGVEGSNLKIEYVQKHSYPHLSFTKKILLPLDKNKRTKLRVESFQYGAWSLTKFESNGVLTFIDGTCETNPEELSLAIVDEQKQITATVIP